MTSGRSTGPNATDAAARQPGPPTGIVRTLLALPVVLYRARLGRLLGHRFLLLRQRGRKTGRIRQVVVEVVCFDPPTGESVVLAGWGRKTQWLQNVLAGGAIEIETAGGRYRPRYRVLDPAEAARLFADYERRNRFVAPVVRRVLSSLLGWRYDGSPSAREQAMRQLVMVGFRPANH